MPLSKRLLDIALSLFMALVLAPVLIGLLFRMWQLGERPFFYGSERVKSPTETFTLWKLRSMRVVEDDENTGVAGGDKADRITPFGAFLRKHRLDEIPQLYNIFRGDMSFVGPRPELPDYIAKLPPAYRTVLRSRPGVTGLATIIYHRHEEVLLEPCKTAEETDAVYSRACLPRKARLDMIYQQNWSFCFDLKLIFGTVGRLLTRSD